MRHDVGIRGQGTEKSMVVVVRNMLIDELHGDGDFLAISIKLHVVKFQVEDIPLSAVDGLVSNSVFGFFVGDPGWTSVRLKSFLAPQIHQLISDIFVTLFKMLQPREVLRVPNYRH